MLKRILAATILLGGMLLYITRVELAGDRVKAKTEKPFHELVPAQINSIAIAPQSGASFELKNGRGEAALSDSEREAKTVTDETLASWTIAGIANARLDSAALNGLLSALGNFTLSDGISREEAGSDLSVYGLTEPVLKLSVTTRSLENESPQSTQRTVSFGKVNEYVNQRYARIDGDEALYLVSSDLFNAASKKVEDFRNRTPLMTFDGTIKAFELSSAGAGGTLQSIKFERREDERGVRGWRMTNPGPYTANSSTVDDVIAAVRSARADSFVDGSGQTAPTSEKLAEYGLESPRFIAQLTLEQVGKPEPRVVSARIGAFKNQSGSEATSLLVEGADTIYVLEGDLMSRLRKGPEQYRERKLIPVSLMDVTQYAVARPGLETIYVKRGKDQGAQSTWTVHVGSLESEGKSGDTPFIEQYVTTISSLEAKQFLEAGSIPVRDALAPAAVRGSVEFSLSNGKSVKVTVGGELTGEPVLSVGDGSEPFTISAMELNRLLPLKETFVKVQAAVQPISQESSAEPTPAANAKE